MSPRRVRAAPARGGGRGDATARPGRALRSVALRAGEPVSVDEVAQAAGVARSTIYLIFGSRAGLFDALAAELFKTGEFALVESAAANPDARESLRDSALGGVRMFAAHRDVFRVLYSMAQLDAKAVGGAVQRLEAARAGGMSRLAARLADSRSAAQRRHAEEAAHVLWLLSSFDAFDVLFTGRGLGVDEVAELLTAVAERALCR